MDQQLQDHLEILNSENLWRKPNEAEIIIKKICKCFRKEQSKFTNSLLISLLLNENDIIFTFIWKASTTSESSVTIPSILKLLIMLINNFKEVTEPYFNIIFQKCLLLVDAQFAKVKEYALLVIKNLLSTECSTDFELYPLLHKIKKYLSSDKKIPGTVIKQIYTIVGLLFAKYPEIIKNESAWFYNNISECLRTEITAKKFLSLSKICGAFEGIQGYLVNFPLPKSDTAQDLYRYIKYVVQEEKQLPLHPELKLFQNHWTYFAKFAHKDVIFWKAKLMTWIRKNGKSQQSAFDALCALCQMIALVAKQEAWSPEAVKQHFQEFMNILGSDKSNSWEKRFALTGIKYFVLTDLFKDELDEMCMTVIKVMRLKGFTSNYTYVPLCIECTSAFIYKCCGRHILMENLNQCDFTFNFWRLLQQLTLLLISQYPKFEVNLKSQSLIALEKSFYMLGLFNLQTLKTHLNKIIYQGLINSCSSVTRIDLEILVGCGHVQSEPISFKSYLSLWSHLLNLSNTPSEPIGGPLSLKRGVAVAVFDAYVNSFLKIILKMNLATSKSPQFEENSERSKDVKIFMNAVDLYQDMVKVIDGIMLARWMSKILQTAISQSYKNPLVAGFYKIIAETLKVGNKIEFFNCSVENRNIHMVTRFLEHVVQKVNHYKNELQMACLETLFAASYSLVEPFWEKIIPGLKLSIGLGRGHFPLVDALVNALERWTCQMPPSSMQHLMEAILPDLDVFLRNVNSDGSIAPSDSQFLHLQKRLLNLLGHLQMETTRNLTRVRGRGQQIRHLNESNLTYRLACGSHLTDINLDEILVRTIDLALCCGDRVTRMAACELLYSLVVIMIGQINQMNGGFAGSFVRAIRACLVLSCDSDSVVYQIFEPLMFQITHYFSGRRVAHLSETQDLIKILIELMSRPYDAVARDLAVRLLCEFTLWSIKELTPEQVKTTPEIIERILNNMFALSIHPSYNKRIGAAALFNRLLTVLEEEEYILQIYWFQLFYHFMQSLKMCGEEEDVSCITESIHHIKCRLLEKAEELNEECPDRVVPAEFEDGLLHSLVSWTMKHCSHQEKCTRETAVLIVEELSPKVRGCQSLKSFLQRHEPEMNFEINLDYIQGTDMQRVNRYAAIFHYYWWLLKEGVITPENVFGFNFSLLSTNFCTDILTIEPMYGTENCKRQTICWYLNLLMALKSKSRQFTPDTWKIIQICLFKPSKLGFHLDDVGTFEPLFLSLTQLFTFFNSHLSYTNWRHFYHDLESLIAVPVFPQIIRNRQVESHSLEFLFSLRVIEKSGIWTTFMEEMRFSLDGNLLLDKVWRSLFFKSGKSVVAASLDPDCKMYLEDFLKLTLRVGVEFDRFLACIQDLHQVSDEDTGIVMTKGDYFNLVFNGVVLEFLEIHSNNYLNKLTENSSPDQLKYLIRIFQNKVEGDKRNELAREVIRSWPKLKEIRLENEKVKSKLLMQLALGVAHDLADVGSLKDLQIQQFICGIREPDDEDVHAIANLLPYLSDYAEEENVVLSNYLKENYLKQQELLVPGVLDCLQSTGSLVALKYVLMTPLTPIHHSKQIENSFSVFAKMPCQISFRALMMVFEACFNSEASALSILSFFHTFLVPMLNFSPSSNMFELMKCKLDFICHTLLKPVERDSPRLVDRNLAMKICAGNIIEKLMSKMDKRELDELAKDKKNLLDMTVKKSFDFLKWPQPGTAGKEIYRKFMCQLFNMISTIISTRSTDHKLYKLFIFDERGSFLYKAVDFQVEYDLEMDFEEIPRRKKLITSLRKRTADEREEGEGEGSREDAGIIQYVQSDSLFSSSLEEDVTHFDLGNSTVRHRVTRSQPEEQPGAPGEQIQVNLEADKLNSHECMATITGIISKMAADNIVPSEASGENLPCWLNFFLVTLSNAETPFNLKLFSLKVIYNVQDQVGEYSEKAFPVLLKALWQMFEKAKLNYMLIDMIEMMVKWKCKVQGAESAQALTKLATMIIRKSQEGFRRDIVKYNLEIVKLMMETWNEGFLGGDFEFVFEQLLKYADDDINQCDNSDLLYLYVQVSGILLTNRVPLWKANSEKLFFNTICRYFNKENKSYERFAEVCGLALKYLKDVESPSSLKELEDFVCEKISNVKDGSRELALVYGVHLHYPGIIDKFTYKILISTWKTSDSFAVKKMEMLLAHSKTGQNDDFFSHLFLLDKMKSADVAVQEIALEIIHNVIDNMDAVKSRMITHEVIKLWENCNSNVRKWVYALAIKYYGRNKDAGDSDEDDSNRALFDKCKVVILKGLTDRVKELEKKCLEFWMEQLMSNADYSTLINIIETFYCPEVESVLLSNSIKVLLESAWKIQRDDHFIFTKPIVQNIMSQKRDIVTGIRQTSIFNLMSNKVGINESVEVAASLKNNHIMHLKRENASIKFEPGLGSRLPMVTTTTKSSGGYSLKNPTKKRFRKNPANIKYTYMKWQKQKKGENVHVEKEESGIELLGEYNTGDFPNIQIKHNQVLKPLQVLAGRDARMASLFLYSLYTGLLQTIANDEREKLLEMTKKCFKMILMSTTSHDPGVVGFIFRVLLNSSQKIHLDCKLISTSAISSNWLSLGALIMEQLISQDDHFESSPPKKSKGPENASERNWLELARLYRHLEESDVVSGIFLDKLRVVGNARDAFKHEMTRNWAAASASYRDVIADNPCIGAGEFYTESYLWCLAKLSDWSLLNNSIRNTVDGDLGKIWQNYYLLFWFIKSEMMMSLESNTNNFKNTIDEFLKNKNKWKLLLSNFPEEMSVYDWCTGRIVSGNQKIDWVYLDFLANWSYQNEFCGNLGTVKLLKLQTTSELGQIFSILGHCKNSYIEDYFKMGMERWARNVPALEDDLMCWDAKLTYRKKFTDGLNDQNLEKVVMKSNLEFIRAALSQKNLALSCKYLDRVRRGIGSADADIQAEFEYLNNLQKVACAKRKNVENVDVKSYIEIWSEISKQIHTKMEIDDDDSRGHVYRNNMILGDIVSEILSFITSNQKESSQVLESIRNHLRIETLDAAQHVIDHLKSKGLEYLETAENISAALDMAATVKSDTYLQLVQFLLKFSNVKKVENFVDLSKYLLKSMSLGNVESRRVFGRILSLSLQVEGLSDAVFDILKADSDAVPSWMFLMWTSQILTYLNCKLHRFLQPILVRMAQDYPNSVKYAFKLYKDEYQPESIEIKSFVQRLSELLLNDRTFLNFFSSLQYLVSPDLVLTFHLEKLLKQTEQNNWALEEIKSALKKLRDFMFSPEFDSIRGPIFKMWVPFRNRLDHLMSLGLDRQAWQTNVKEILISIKNFKSPSKRMMSNLASFSPWLSNFHTLKAELNLEIPGQYNGEGEPTKQSRVTISSFKVEVTMLESKCKPLKIVILGNDASEYPFLVKFTEDLRQDESIQQIFRQFNSGLLKSRFGETLSLDTYKVIPLTCDLGMIEWVDNSLSLQELMVNAIKDDGASIKKSQIVHLQVLSSNCQVKNPAEAHLKGYENVKRNLAVSAFNQRVNAFPRDLLKRSFMDLSTSPEQFTYLRKNFAISYAVLCISHWLVGIGDRHLQNTLVSAANGRVLGIDFGYAFGFSTQFLTPPELIPFRLTPQVLNLMDPLCESGWIKQAMVHSLRMFRWKNFVLSSVLEVLCLNLGTRSPTEEKENDRHNANLAGLCTAEHKISIIQRKLSGTNPIAVLEAELKVGHSESEYLEKYLEILKGDRECNVRARMNEDGLTEEDEIECLIDLATDPHVLAKTYVGWNPWL